MDKVGLGRSGLQVSPISLATWPLAALADEETALATIGRARDLGVNIFDTAPALDRGRSEALLADALGGEIREHHEDIVIATEGGMRRDGHALVADARPEVLRQDVDDTLRVLDVDAIDLYQVPWPDPTTPIDRTLGELSNLVDAGKVRHAGISVLTDAAGDSSFTSGLLEALEVPSFLFRRHVDGLWLPYARAHDLGVLVGAPSADDRLGLDLGLTSLFALPVRPAGHPATLDRPVLRRPAHGGTNRPLMVRPGTGYGRPLRPVPVREARPDPAGTSGLATLAAAHEVSLPDLLVAWTLAQPAVHVVIVGAGTPDQIQESVAAVDLDLSAGDLSAIADIRSGPSRAA